MRFIAMFTAVAGHLSSDLHHVTTEDNDASGADYVITVR